MRLTLVLVCVIAALAVGCGESETSPSADQPLAEAVLPEPTSTDPRADLASQAIWDFADAFNEHDWTLASRFVLPLYADMFREGVEHAAQNGAQLQFGEVTVTSCGDDSCDFSTEYTMSPVGYCNPLFRRGSDLATITVSFAEGEWVVRWIATYGGLSC